MGSFLKNMFLKKTYLTYGLRGACDLKNFIRSEVAKGVRSVLEIAANAVGVFKFTECGSAVATGVRRDK